MDARQHKKVDWFCAQFWCVQAKGSMGTSARVWVVRTESKI